MQVIRLKNNGYASFGGRSLITTTPFNSCLTNKNNKKQMMANFGEVMSKFYKLGKNKGIDNGLYQTTLMCSTRCVTSKKGKCQWKTQTKSSQIYMELF